MNRLSSLTLAWLALLITSPSLAAPTALDVTPPDTVFTFAVRGVGQVESMLNAHANKMVDHGLEDPGLQDLWNLTWDALEIAPRGEQSIASALGLSADGSIAIYFSKVADKDLGVVVMDVGDRQALIRTLQKVMASANEGDGGEKGKVHTTKTRLPSGGLDVVITADGGGDPMHARFQGNLVAISDKKEALDRVPFAGGSATPGIEPMSDPKTQVGFFFAVDIQKGVTLGMFPPPASVVPRVRWHALFNATGGEGELVANLAPDLEPYLNILKPGANGAKARAAMAALVSGRSDVWGRFSYDQAAAAELAKTFLGPGFKEVETNFAKTMGFDLQDVLDGFTGDQLLRCDGSLPTCVFAIGIKDRRAVDRVFRHSSARLADELTGELEVDVTVETVAVARTRDGAQRMVTTFFIPKDLDEAEDTANTTDDGAKAKKKAKKRRSKKPVELRPVAAFHWGLSEDLAVISLTPNAVDAALTKPSGGGSSVSPTAANLAGDDATLIAGYQASADIGDLLRQILPVLRGVLPAKFEGGMVLRAIDALVLFQDYTLDGASYIRVDGTQITLRGSTVSLPDPGQPGYDEAATQAFAQALRHRYIGDVAESNRLLARLAFENEGTPIGRKADNYAFATEALGSFASGLYMAAMMDSPAFQFLFEDLARSIFEAPEPYDSPGFQKHQAP